MGVDKVIDWTKPIETVDGRPARKLVTGVNELWHCVYVKTPGFIGDVYLVNHEGHRCDDRCTVSEKANQFIRNVKVKKEGWVLMVPPTKTSFVSFTGPMYATKEKALEALEEVLMKMDYHSALSFKQPGIKPVHLKWEE
jgi:hypothetical protein